MEGTIMKSYNQSKIHPHKFALWISMASIMMMFGAFTSAYLVRQGAGNWLEFGLPDIFYISTLIILLSSLTLHASFINYKKEKEALFKNLLILTFVLGISFLVLQYYGWMHLFNMGIDLKGNPSGSFLYVITGIHALHIIGGIAALTVALLHAFTLKFKLTPKRKIRFELVIHYWHFIGLLWVYLFGFLLLSR